MSVLSSLFFTLAVVTPGAVFEVDYQNVPDEYRVAFDEASASWGQCIVSEVPIKIHVAGIARGPTGFAYPNVVRNRPGLPVKNAWYPTALASAIEGTRVTDKADMAIYLSARTPWYFGKLEGLPAEKTDFVNVAIHEIAHGLGIATAAFIPTDGPPLATIGFPNPYTDFFDFPFSLHEQDGTPFVYDTFLHLADGQPISGFPQRSVRLARALTNPTIHFRGKAASTANQGLPVGVEPGSVSHIPQAPRSIQPIMLANSGRGKPLRTPDPILLGMMEDIGWTITEQCRSNAAGRVEME